MSALKDGRCVPCERGATPLSFEESAILLKELSTDWKLEDFRLRRRFNFRDFREAMNFTNKVADIAEKEWHHPDIKIFFNIVDIELWTHSIKGLSKNDFVLAAKIDTLSG